METKNIIKEVTENDNNNDNNVNEKIIYIEKIVYKLPPSYYRSLKKYREAHPEVMQNICKKYYEKSLKGNQEYLQKKREYYYQHKEHIIERQRQYRKNQKENKKSAPVPTILLCE